MTDHIDEALIHIIPDFRGFRTRVKEEIKLLTENNTVDFEGKLATAHINREIAKIVNLPNRFVQFEAKIEANKAKAQIAELGGKRRIELQIAVDSAKAALEIEKIRKLGNLANVNIQAKVQGLEAARSELHAFIAEEKRAADDIKRIRAEDKDDREDKQRSNARLKALQAELNMQQQIEKLASGAKGKTVKEREQNQQQQSVTTVRAKLDDAIARRDLAVLTRDHTTKIQARLDIDRFQTELLAAQKALGHLGGAGGGGAGGENRPRSSPGGSILSRLGGGRLVNFLQGTAIVGLVTNITPVTAAVTGLASSFALAGGAASAFGVAAAGHMVQITTVLKQVNEQGQKLSDLPAPFQRLIPAINQFQGTWNKFLQSTRGPVFDTFAAGLSFAGGLLQKLVPVVNSVADVITTAINRFANSPALEHFIDVMQTAGPKAVDTLINSALNLGDGLLNIFADFAPAGQTMLDVIEKMTQKFSDWASSLAGSSGFNTFLDYAKENGPKVLELFSNLIVLTANLITALAPLGAVVIYVLEGFTRLLSSISPAWWQGLATTALAFYAVMKYLVIVSTVTGWFKSLTAALTSYKVITFIATLTTDGLIASLAALTAAELLTGIGALVVGIGIIATALYAWNASSDVTTKLTEANTSAIDALTDSLLRNSGALDENDKLQRAKALQEKGILGSPGVDNATAVAGISGDAKAFDATMKVLYDRRAMLWQQQQDLILAGIKNPPQGKDAIKRANEAGDAAQKAIDDNEKNIASYQTLGREYDSASIKANQLANSLKTIGNASKVTASDIATFASSLQKAMVMPDLQAAATSVLGVMDKFKNAGIALDKGIRDQAKTIKDTARANVMADRAVADSKANLANVIKQTAQSEVDASERVKSAELAQVKAVETTRKAVEALAKAREDAARALEDQSGKELAANIAAERAKNEAASIGMDVGPRTPEWMLRQAEIRENLTATATAAKRETAQGAILRAQGIEGAPGVINARNTLADDKLAEQKADADLVKAHADQTTVLTDNIKKRRDAQTQYNDSLYNQQKTLEDGKQANLDAITNTDNLRNAQALAKIDVDNMNKSLEDQAFKAGVSHDQFHALQEKLAEGLKTDGTDVVAKLKDIQTWIVALKMISVDPSLTPDTAWAAAEAQVSGVAPVYKNFNSLSGTEGLRQGQFSAQGGPIYGPGSGTSDSVRAMGPIPGIDYYLSNDEHVWTASEVHGAGGHGNVKKIRAAAKYGAFKSVFADGGPVIDISKMPLADELIQSGILDRAADAYGFAPKVTDVGASLGSKAIEAAAFAVAKAMGASARAMLALFEAGIVESGFKNYANSTVPESMGIPHDAVGHDHDSVGYLQQRPGWGSVSQRMNASYATRKFLEKAIGYDGNFKGSAGQLAQRVQVSAFPNAYDRVQGQAQAILNSVLTTIATPGVAAHYTLADRPLFLGAGNAGPGGAGPGFLPWPSSHGAQRGDSGVWHNIVDLVNSSGIPHSFGNAYRAGDPLWHGSGRAVDWMGYNQTALAEFFMARAPQMLELIHRTDTKDYGLTRGHSSPMRAQLPLHRNHLHVAMSGGGPIDSVIADSGALLPPMSRTLVTNNTNKPERVGFDAEMRLDRYTISMIAQALQQRPYNASFDGKQAAEVVMPHVANILKLPGV